MSSPTDLDSDGRVLRPGGHFILAETTLRHEVPPGSVQSLEDWFRWIGGALPEASLLAMIRAAGLDPVVLERGRNARTGAEASQVSLIRAYRRASWGRDEHTTARRAIMARTFMQMVGEAQAEVPGLSVEEARRRIEQDPHTLVVDVRDAASIQASGMIPGAAAISAGALLYKADQEVPEEWRDARLQDRSRPVITQCDLGPLSAIAAKNLKDMGFTNVNYLKGGIQGRKDAGLPTQLADDGV